MILLRSFDSELRPQWQKLTPASVSKHTSHTYLRYSREMVGRLSLISLLRVCVKESGRRSSARARDHHPRQSLGLSFKFRRLQSHVTMSSSSPKIETIQVVQVGSLQTIIMFYCESQHEGPESKVGIKSAENLKVTMYITLST